MKEINILGRSVRTFDTNDPEAAPASDFVSVEHFMDDAEKAVDEAVDRFFAISLRDMSILKAAKAWERAEKDLLGYAGTLFRISSENQDRQKHALDLMDKVSKLCNIRQQNIIIHQRLITKSLPDNDQQQAEKDNYLEKLSDAKSKMGRFMCCALKTQQSYLDHFMRGDNFESPEISDGKRAAARAEEFRKLIPHDVMYLPAWVYPPKAFPPNVRVPEPPVPLQLMKKLPPSAKIFDRKLNEFVVKPGFVSEDGLIDDQSVVFNTDEKTVTMKFRGGEPVTWPYWKPRDERDVIDPNSWAAEYLRRLQQQIDEDKQIGVLKHRSEETEDFYPYNRIPEQRSPI